MTRYADSPFWAPEVAAALDLFNERKAAAQGRANNLMLTDETRECAQSECDVYGYAELRLQETGWVTLGLIEEVTNLMNLGIRFNKAEASDHSSEDPASVATVRTYGEVVQILEQARGQHKDSARQEAVARAICTALDDKPDAQDDGQAYRAYLDCAKAALTQDAAGILRELADRATLRDNDGFYVRADALRRLADVLAMKPR